MRGTIRRLTTSSASSREVQWLMGRPDFSGGSQATATMPTICSGLKVAGTPRARDVVEDLLDERRQLLVTEQAALRLVEFGGGLQPAIAPLANGEAGQTQEFGSRIDARVGGKSEEDGDAANQTLAGGLAGAKALQQGLHARGQHDGDGRRSTHDPPIG